MVVGAHLGRPGGAWTLSTSPAGCSLARREGNRRYYDLTERLFPAELLARAVPEREQMRHKVLSRYRAHGLLGAGGSGELWAGDGQAALGRSCGDELLDRGELAAVDVEGLQGRALRPGDELALLAQAERESRRGAAGGGRRPAGRRRPPGCSFLAPLDPLMWDREALAPLYDFDYRWEVYTPAAKRRWGYYVLPVMFGDRLVGRIEPRLDRTAKVVRVLGLTWEPGFEPWTHPASCRRSAPRWPRTWRSAAPARSCRRRRRPPRPLSRVGFGRAAPARPTSKVGTCPRSKPKLMETVMAAAACRAWTATIPGHCREGKGCLPDLTGHRRHGGTERRRHARIGGSPRHLRAAPGRPGIANEVAGPC